MPGLSPAIITLDNTLKSSIPFLKGKYKESKGSLPRTQTTTGALYDRHATGLAIDIILFATKCTNDTSVDHVNEKKLGENLVKIFLDLKDSMKWTELIYMDRFFWLPDRYESWTKDRKHFTHIHIDWMTNSYKGKEKPLDFIVDNSPQGKTTEFAAKLSARLNQVNEMWENKTLENFDISSVYPTYALDVNPVGIWQITSTPWFGTYTIEANGSVKWSDINNKSGTGTWRIIGNKVDFKWNGSTTTESWTLPIMRSKITGTAIMSGKKYSVEAIKSV